MQQKNKKEKRVLSFYGIQLTKETLFKALYALAIIIAVCILLESIEGKAWVGFSLIFLCFCAWYYHITKLDDSRNLYRKVAWIVTKECHGLFPGRTVSLRNLELVEYIEIEQSKQCFPEQFQIDLSNKIEKNNLIKILTDHKNHVCESYFQDWLMKSKNVYSLNSLEYYFFSLYSFVNNNLSAYKVPEAYSNRERISDRQFKLQLTDYGRTYYKLYLITQLYTENNQNVQKLCDYIDKDNKKHIMEVLDKNEVNFLQYLS